MRMHGHRWNVGRAALGAVVAGLLWAPVASGQGNAATRELERQIERRFTVLPITNGLVLTPRTTIAGVRSIQLEGGTIAIDGTPVTGAELREKLGDAADAVIQLSYLSPSERAAFAAAPDGSRSPEPPAPASPPSPSSPPSTDSRDQFQFRFPPRARGGELVKVGRDVTVEPGQVVRGSAVSVGGSVRVSGEVRGEVISIGGDVDLGPTAVVSENVVSIGGRVHRDPAARVGGEVQEVGWDSAWVDNFWRRTWSGSRPVWSFAAPLALITQVTRIALLCLLAVLVVLVGGNVVDRVGRRAAEDPLKAGAVGFLAQVLFLPLLIVTILLLVVTIIGIPLLVLIPFAVLGLVLVALVGFTAVASRVGQAIATRLSWQAGPYLATVTGVLTLLVPLLLARVIGLGGLLLSPIAFSIAVIGWIVEYLAWTVGFGAVALTRFSKSGGAPVGAAPSTT